MDNKAERKDILPLLDSIAEELEQAKAHILVAKQHAQDNEVPRFGAHMLSAEGHIVTATDIKTRVAKIHAAHSVPTV